MKSNKISFIEDDSFLNLSDSLWSIDLSNNKIAYLTNRTLRGLKILRDFSVQQSPLLSIDSFAFLDFTNYFAYDENIGLALNRMKLNRLKENTLYGLFKLNTHLTLDYNQIKVIDQGAFRGLNELYTLSLKNNLITNLNRDAFSGMKELFNLKLSNNFITSLEKESFFHLKSLSFLELDHNLIYELNSFSFSYLTSLDCLI
jgi:hypothetical protein